MKTSSPKDFLVTPITGQIFANRETAVVISFTGPAENKDKGQKFLIQTVAASDVSLANWTSREVQEFKLMTRFVHNETAAFVDEKPRVEEKPRVDESPKVEEPNVLRGSIYADPEEDKFEAKEKENTQELEEEKKIITARNSELTNSIDKLKADVEKAQHKLKFSKDIDIISSDSIGKYSLAHLIAAFFIGIFLGYYILG